LARIKGSAIRRCDTALAFNKDAAMDEIHYKRWRIEVLRGEPRWKTLVYYPESPLHGTAAPDGADRRAVMKEAKALVGSKDAS